MKHRKKIIGVITAVMLLACLAAIPVMAQPPVCSFSGTVTLNGASVAAGTTITAKADDTEVGTTDAYIEGVSKYFMVIPQGTLTEGAALNFYVGDNLATTSGDAATWEIGGTKTVNLAATSGAVYYTLTVTPTAGGSVSLDPPQPAEGYAAGTVVELTANAAIGYEFSSWSGDASGTTAITYVTMNGSKTVQANFVSVGPTEYPSFYDWLAWWM